MPVNLFPAPYSRIQQAPIIISPTPASHALPYLGGSLGMGMAHPHPAMSTAMSDANVMPSQSVRVPGAVLTNGVASELYSSFAWDYQLAPTQSKTLMYSHLHGHQIRTFNTTRLHLQGRLIRITLVYTLICLSSNSCTTCEVFQRRRSLVGSTVGSTHMPEACPTLEPLTRVHHSTNKTMDIPAWV
jgi:hypothetical protein